MNVLDLFSGIGGFSLGLELTGGFTTEAFVEIDPFCRRVLKKHWPQVPQYEDIKAVSVRKGDFKIFAGGFPCQDVSTAGCNTAQESILGERSGLWTEYLRLISEGLPTWVLIENVENLRNKGLGIILSQLATLGYDAEWHVIGACHVGLPHFRKRLWVVAHRNSNGVEGRSPFPLQGFEGLQRGQNFRRFEDFIRGSNYYGTGLCRSLSGIPFGVDRLRAIGNSVTPLIPFILGQAILNAEERLNAPKLP